MITDLKTVPTDQLEYFLTAITLGLQTFTLSDSNEIIVEKKVFDVNSGIALPNEVLAAVPRANLDAEIANCDARSAMISAFIVANNI